jgi:signal transduction histidine kinase
LWPNATRQREDPEAPRLISPAQVAPVRPEGAAESVLVEQREPIWQPDQWRPRLPALLAVWGRRCRRLRIGFAGSAGREAAARWGALLFAIAGVLGLVALAFPGGAGTSSVAAAATSFLACAVGGWLWLAGARLSAGVYQLLALLAVALVCVSACYGGAEGWLDGFYFFWIALFVAYFFSLPAVALQTGAIAVAYAPTLALNHAIRHRPLIWFLTVATVAVTAAVVSLLRRRLEQALEVEHRQVERLLELDRLKDDFIATVSHELRTPVSAVYGAAETLLARDLPAFRRTELLRVTHQQALRLAELVEHLLISASLDRGALTGTVDAIDPTLPVLAAVEAARAREPTRTIGIDADHDIPRVAADRARLQQALTALLDNALKYSPPAAPITVRLERLPARARISVVDAGPGIPGPERERVFDKFHRLDPTMRNGIGGSGLGLHIVRKLVIAMGGNVWIESATPTAYGTRVVLELPLAEPTRQDDLDEIAH